LCIKIQTSCGKSPSEIHNELQGIRGDSTVDCYTISCWVSETIQVTERLPTVMDYTYIVINSLLKEDCHMMWKLPLK